MHDEFDNRVRKPLVASVAIKQKLSDDIHAISAIARAARVLTDAFRGGHKAILFGNGGRAADAQHIALMEQKIFDEKSSVSRP